MSRLRNDHAVACAAVVVDLVRPLLREEEAHELFALVREAVAATLARYHATIRSRRRRPPGPSRN